MLISLISSGCRGVGARCLIENAKGLKVVNLGRFISIHVDLQKGSKREFITYLPKEIHIEVKNH